MPIFSGFSTLLLGRVHFVLKWLQPKNRFVGSMGARHSSHEKPPSKLEKRMVKALVERAQKGQVMHKTFNSIILKFPRIDEAFETVRDVFKKFDEDASGTIDLQELKHCFAELQVNFLDEEVKAFYEESDVDGSHAIDFREFIVLLAFVYFLGTSDEGNSSKLPSRIGLPQLEETFEIILNAFVFFDINGDGYVSKPEMIQAINLTSPHKSGDRIGVRRFEEMDWDKNGSVTFKEFLFAFTDWVGLEENSDH